MAFMLARLEQKGLLWVLVQLSQLNRQKGLGLDLELLNLLLPLFLLGEVVVLDRLNHLLDRLDHQ